MAITEELDVIFKVTNEKKRTQFWNYFKRKVQIKYIKGSLEDKVERKDRET